MKNDMANNNVNDTFLGYAGLFMLGGFIMSPSLGFGAIVAAGIAAYLMLTATNAIDSGERKIKKKRLQEK
jgi:hypothetical protein